jgi:hypothetical protein
MKYLLIGIAVILSIFFLLGAYAMFSQNLDPTTYQYKGSVGYAPFIMEGQPGWTREKNIKDYIALTKQISADMPYSNIVVTINSLQYTSAPITTTVDEYVDKYWLPEMKTIHNATVISKGSTIIDGIPSKDIVSTRPVTINGITRTVKGRVIVFIKNEFIYEFSLATFEKNWDIANKEFEAIVTSFHFTK